MSALIDDKAANTAGRKAITGIYSLSHFEVELKFASGVKIIRQGGSDSVEGRLEKVPWLKLGCFYQHKVFKYYGSIGYVAMSTYSASLLLFQGGSFPFIYI